MHSPSLPQPPASPGTVILEAPSPAPVPAVMHAGWARDFPWLVQGTTTRGPGGAPFDLRLYGPASAGEVLPRWDALRAAHGMLGVVHSAQVHGPRVLLHGEAHDGLRLASSADGHATRARGLLLTVGTADCVPLFLVDPARRWIALLHAGWRGVAAGILEAALDTFEDRMGVLPDGLHLHLGPSICGRCYEVGPEVHGALGLPDPGRPAPVDLRRVLAVRGVAAGISSDRITLSGHCTLCGPGTFFSHRGGDPGRQVGFLGVRESISDGP